MRSVYAILFLLLALLAGSWWLGTLGLACKLPIYYSVGTVDERFGITRGEAQTALAEAEAVWESSLGREDIFAYKEDASLRINFIYDERQRQAAAAAAAKDDLDARGGANEVLVELHRQLVEEYKGYETDYESRRSAYEKNLAAYNAEVESYNDQGGAPPEEYEALEKKRETLDSERARINDLAEKLNDLSDRINSIGEKGNELITEYNDRVNQFNDTYVHEKEYTQGDYQGRQINIYTFNSKRELTLVLAHEFGHALSLDHAKDPTAIMYYLMGGQKQPPSLTDEDKEAFMKACEQGIIDRLLTVPRIMYNTLVNK